MQGPEIVRKLWRPGYIATVFAVCIAVGSLMPAENASSLPGSGFGKHAFPYGFLSFFTVLAVRGRVNAGIVLVGVFGYGLVLETVQPIFGREFDVDDLIANAVGSLFGLGAALGFERVTRQVSDDPSPRGSDQG